MCIRDRVGRGDLGQSLMQRFKVGAAVLLLPGDVYKRQANAIYQNLSFIDRYDPKYVIILSGDQICKQDYACLLYTSRCV